MWNQTMETRCLVDNPIPRDHDFARFWQWFEPFSEAERAARAEASNADQTSQQVSGLPLRGMKAGTKQRQDCYSSE